MKKPDSDSSIFPEMEKRRGLSIIQIDDRDGNSPFSQQTWRVDPGNSQHPVRRTNFNQVPSFINTHQ